MKEKQPRGVLGFDGYFLPSGLAVIALGGIFLTLRGTWSRLLSPIR